MFLSFLKKEVVGGLKNILQMKLTAFSFYYQNQQVFFFSIGLPVKEWNQVKMHKKFLRLVVNGHFILFDSKSLVRFGNNYAEVTDYYISDTKNKIFNIADNDFARFDDFLLKKLKIECEFIQNQPYKIHSRNIKTIIKNYNDWIKRNGPHRD